MRVFVTGASGYIGNAVALAFRRAGHRVYGMVRNETRAHGLLCDEIEPVIGQLSNPPSYAAALQQSDVYVHCAFDMSDHGVQQDKETIGVLLAAARAGQSRKTIIYTSGCWVYGNTGHEVVDEGTPARPLPLVAWRPKHEQLILDNAKPSLRTLVMRPGCVYGGLGGLTGIWFSSARRGSVDIVDRGQNRWPMIHVQDLASVYVLAAEQEAYNGLIFNISDGSRNTVREMCEEVARVAGIPGSLRFLNREEASVQYGGLAEGLLADLQMSSSRARLLLGWQPRHCNFLDFAADYWKAWNALHGF